MVSAENATQGFPDTYSPEYLPHFVVLVAGYEPSDNLVKDIQDFVKNVTAPYKYPRRVEFRDALPKTISGKIRRVELRDEARDI